VKQYTVATPIKHGGARYEVDATIDLDDAAAAPLLACGAVAQLTPAGPDDGGDDGGTAAATPRKKLARKVAAH